MINRYKKANDSTKNEKLVKLFRYCTKCLDKQKTTVVSFFVSINQYIASVFKSKLCPLILITPKLVFSP